MPLSIVLADTLGYSPAQIERVRQASDQAPTNPATPAA